MGHFSSNDDTESACSCSDSGQGPSDEDAHPCEARTQRRDCRVQGVVIEEEKLQPWIVTAVRAAGEVDGGNKKMSVPRNV